MQHRVCVCASAAQTNVLLSFWVEFTSPAPHTLKSFTHNKDIEGRSRRITIASLLCGLIVYCDSVGFVLVSLFPAPPHPMCMCICFCVYACVSPWTAPQRFLAAFIVFCCAAAHHEEVPSLCNGVRRKTQFCVKWVCVWMCVCAKRMCVC